MSTQEKQSLVNKSWVTEIVLYGMKQVNANFESQKLHKSHVASEQKRASRISEILSGNSVVLFWVRRDTSLIHIMSNEHYWKVFYTLHAETPNRTDFFNILHKWKVSVKQWNEKIQLWCFLALLSGKHGLVMHNLYLWCWYLFFQENLPYHWYFKNLSSAILTGDSSSTIKNTLPLSLNPETGII